MLRRDMPIILLHLFVCTFPLSGRCHHSTPHLSSLSLPFLSLFVCALNEMKIAAHCEALRAANRRAKFHFITKAKAEWKNRKPKRKKKLKKRKRKYKTGTGSHSKRRQQALTATPFQFRFGFIPFNTHSGHCTPCGRRNSGERGVGRHFFHLYTREITQKLSKHCRCAAGLIENDSGSWVRHAKSNCTHCAYAAWHTQHLCLLAADAAPEPRMHAIIIASSLHS